MAISRPFAYNPTLVGISGTIQVGDLAIGTPVDGFESTGLEWWNGPDENLGYVIAVPVPLDNQDTPVPGDNLYLDPTHKATDIALSNSDQTAAQIFGYQQSVLGLTSLMGDKFMFSVKYTSSNPSVGVGDRFVGIGTTHMNYPATFGAYPGNDGESFGFSDAGKTYFSGSSTSGFSTWTSGDIIDVSVSGNMIWFRVNGGSWNNSPTADPSNDSEGIDIGMIGGDIYPVLCPAIYGTMTILNVPKYGYPDTFNFLGHTTASVGFLRSSSLTDNSLIDLVNNHFNQSFTTIGDTLTWLSTNNYWNSYPV